MDNDSKQLSPADQITMLSDKEFFLKLKQYIEDVEHQIDGEWGNCRSVEQLISDGAMPDLYFQVLQRITSVAPPEPVAATGDDMNDLADDLLGIVLPEGSGARLITRALELWGRPAIEPEERWYPSFADWLEREMPKGTVIGDPLWWASKIATYLQRYVPVA